VLGVCGYVCGVRYEVWCEVWCVCVGCMCDVCVYVVCVWGGILLGYQELDSGRLGKLLWRGFHISIRFFTRDIT